MTTLLVIGTILIAVIVDVLLVAWRRRSRGRAPEVVTPMREPVIPHGMFLADGHAWARLTTEGALRVGVDDLIAQAMGAVEGIVAAPAGSEVQRGDPLFKVRVGGRELAIAAPVSGRVMSRNENLIDKPWLMPRDPYGAGWAVALWCRDIKQALAPLRIGAGASAYLREELGRLADFLAAATSGGAVRALADGGLPRQGALQILDDRGWRAFGDTFLRQPREEA
jgi:glycine cleavage system H protein